MADDDERDIARTPDKRMQYGELRRKEKEGTGRQGPSPYVRLDPRETPGHVLSLRKRS